MPKTDIDGKMYLLTKAIGTYADSLVISAHGGIKKSAQPDYTTINETLQFYSTHGVVTNDLGLRNFVHGGKEGQKTDTLKAGSLCYDYDLSKYQGKHNKAGETYETIQESIDYVEEFNTLLMEAGREITTTAFDVLTIRNRWNNKNVKLSSALAAVGKIHKYKIVHCYFCRSFY